ncbi:hypothetical protein J3B02_006261 [Coemansia erecta]|nr:hypothetical protein J3B02_006261 [Coemansia erecta]
MDSTQTVRTTVVWPDGTPESVGIRGTFGSDPQHWWQETIELRKTAAADKYTVDLDLPPGKYEFKFVINSTDWRINAQMYTSVDDGSGNTNNVLVVPAKSKSSKASSSSHTALSAEQSSDFDTDQQLDPRNDQVCSVIDKWLV